MHLEHHLVGGYVRYISPYIIIIIMVLWDSSKSTFALFYLWLGTVQLDVSIPESVIVLYEQSVTSVVHGHQLWLCLGS